MFRSIAKEVNEFFTRLRRNDRRSEVEYQQHHRIFTDMSPLAPVLFLLFILAGVVLWDYVPRIWLGLFIFGFISDVSKIGRDRDTEACTTASSNRSPASLS